MYRIRENTNKRIVGKWGLFMILKEMAKDIAKAFTTWNLWQGGGGGGGSIVTITPTLTEGEKIADFSIDGTSGELFAPSGSGEVRRIYQNISTYNQGDIITVSEDISNFKILEFVLFYPSDGVTNIHHTEIVTVDTFKRSANLLNGCLLSGGFYMRFTTVKYLTDRTMQVTLISASGEAVGFKPYICQINGIV